jgi:hypothetical protein
LEAVEVVVAMALGKQAALAVVAVAVAVAVLPLWQRVLVRPVKATQAVLVTTQQPLPN